MRQGRTLVDCFLPTRPDLSDVEQDFLRGWRDVVEGFFEVIGWDGPALVTVNLIDDLEYRVRTNVGPAVFEQMQVGTFVHTRMVPLGRQWLLSGVTTTYSANQRETLLPVVADVAIRSPGLVFRNPDRLARGWELQRADRAAFVEHFGSDTVVLDRAELPRRLGEFAACRYAGSGSGCGLGGEHRRGAAPVRRDRGTDL